MRTIKLLVTILAAASIAGCASSSVHMIGETKTYSAGACKVKVYQTKEAAIKGGLNKEVCVVRGSSTYSFDHSIDGAIKKNFEKICECGADKAYIAAAHTDYELGITKISHVNLVGFR